ncbi:hypothetical protein Agub_g11800, partial [Astrephomene gubernaculifera]
MCLMLGRWPYDSLRRGGCEVPAMSQSRCVSAPPRRSSGPGENGPPVKAPAQPTSSSPLVVKGRAFHSTETGDAEASTATCTKQNAQQQCQRRPSSAGQYGYGLPTTAHVRPNSAHNRSPPYHCNHPDSAFLFDKAQHPATPHAAGPSGGRNASQGTDAFAPASNGFVRRPSSAGLSKPLPQRFAPAPQPYHHRVRDLLDGSRNAAGAGGGGTSSYGSSSKSGAHKGREGGQSSYQGPCSGQENAKPPPIATSTGLKHPCPASSSAARQPFAELRQPVQDQAPRPHCNHQQPHYHHQQQQQQQQLRRQSSCGASGDTCVSQAAKEAPRHDLISRYAQWLPLAAAAPASQDRKLYADAAGRSRGPAPGCKEQEGMMRGECGGRQQQQPQPGRAVDEASAQHGEQQRR